MKNKMMAGAALFLFAPVLGYAAPIQWTTQSYTIDGYLDIDKPYQIGSQLLNLVDNLNNPLAGSISLTSANGNASSELSIRNLSNSSADIQFIANNTSSYIGGNNIDQFAMSVPTASMDNTFVADTSVLRVGYDFNSLIHYEASTSGLSYQDLTVNFRLIHDQDPFGDQLYSLVNIHYKNNQVQNEYSQANQTYTPLLNGVYVFNLKQGDSYELQVDLSPTLFTGGNVVDNSSNSILKLSFSDGNIAAVPEPETYVLLLTGLMLVGFAARRKTR